MLWIKKKRTVKSKPKSKTETKRKSEPKSKKSRANIEKYVDATFRLVLKSVVESFTKTFSAEDVTKAFKLLELEIFRYKESTLSALTEFPSIKEREKIWDKVKELFIEILLPMVTVMNNNIASNIKSEVGKQDVQDDTPLDIPNIGIVSRQSAKDVATVKSRIVA